MISLRTQLIYEFVITLFLCGVTAENSKCICIDNNGSYITTSLERNKEDVIATEVESQVLERLDKLSKVMESLNPSSLQNSTQHVLNCGVNSKFGYPSSCAEATANTRRSGTYSIQTDAFGPKPFQASCNENEHDGGWTVVLRRMDGSVDFFRNWQDYKEGFGNLEGEFFIGLDKLYALTNGRYKQELIFVMEDYENVKKYAKYSTFAIGNENEKYALNVLGNYSGDAGDSFKNHAGHPFKTKEIPDPHNCATQYTGAWWYTACHASNLCGSYLKGAYPQEKYAQGVVWNAWRGYNYSLKFVEMMIRPVRP